MTTENPIASAAGCCSEGPRQACACARSTASAEPADRGCCCGPDCPCGDACDCPSGCGC
jgi:hypothetical protein